MDRGDAETVAEAALLLADLDPSLNLRMASQEHMGFFNVYVPTLEADGPNGSLSVTVRCRTGTDTPCELQFYDSNHAKLLEWVTDLSGERIDGSRTLKFNGTANFHLNS
jgi:hypothetical protein